MQTNLSKILALGFVFAAAIMPVRIFAIAQSVEPINIDNALRGQEYERYLSLTNTDDAAANFEVTATGDIKDFTAFYKSDAPEQANSKLLLSIPGKETVAAIVRFAISSDLKSDKTYKGYINFSYDSTNSDSTKKNQNSVISGVGRPVSIALGGKEVIEAECSFVPVNSFVEMSTPLKIMATCINGGNINIKPSVQVSVSQNGQLVSGSGIVFLYDSNKKGIKPAQSEVLNYELQTGNLNLGTYQVDVRVFQGEKEFQHSIYDVKILEKNTLNTSNKVNLASLSSIAGNNQQWLLIVSIIGLGIAAIVIFLIVKKLSKNKIVDTSVKEN